MKIFLIILSLIFAGTTLFSQDDKVNCNVIFSFSVQENQLSQFSHKVISGSDMIVSYSWDFGDGYTSNEENPEHVYLGSGTYTPCLTVVFDNNCSATYCDTIIIRNPVLDTLQNYGISGLVYAGNALLPNGIAILIKLLNGQYRAIAYTTIDDGNYHFSNLTPGTYYIYAIPYFNLNVLFYPNYFPTYYGNQFNWQDANPIVVNGLIVNKNISLLSSNDLILGDDSITGNIMISDSAFFEYNIYLNNWFDNSLPSQDYLNLAPNQVVLLMDENNKPQRFALTDHMGHFSFRNIPTKIFKVRTEKHGLISEIKEMNLTEGINTVNFTIMSESVVIGINSNELKKISYKMYPNPVESNLFITLSDENIHQLQIRLFDINGKSVYNQMFNHKLSDSYVIPMGHLSSGTYILQLSAPTILPQNVKVVKK
ncbi:MAG TPA: PKD domain-containing protein [Bacteroidales bacterium]|nr:PKD domain-containing protein [Bacteroidales bacterium]